MSEENKVQEDVVSVEKNPDISSVVREPDFFGGIDNVRIKAYIFFDKNTGAIISTSTVEIDAKEFDHVGMKEEWFDFSAMNYEDMIDLTRRATVFRMDAGKPVFDQEQFKYMILVFKLKALSMKYKGEDIKLDFLENGALDEESRKIVMSINPKILNAVLEAFEETFS